MRKNNVNVIAWSRPIGRQVPLQSHSTEDYLSASTEARWSFEGFHWVHSHRIIVWYINANMTGGILMVNVNSTGKQPYPIGSMYDIYIYMIIYANMTGGFCWWDGAPYIAAPLGSAGIGILHVGKIPAGSLRLQLGGTENFAPHPLRALSLRTERSAGSWCQARAVERKSDWTQA